MNNTAFYIAQILINSTWKYISYFHSVCLNDIYVAEEKFIVANFEQLTKMQDQLFQEMLNTYNAIKI